MESSERTIAENTPAGNKQDFVGHEVPPMKSHVVPPAPNLFGGTGE